MTIQTNAYALEAFPTEKMLQTFQPARGMNLKLPIDVPMELLLKIDNSAQRQRQLKAWESLIDWPKSNIDLDEVLRALATKFGYELAALKEGKGDTGRPGHSWTAYAHEKDLPLLVRWEADDASMLFVANLTLQHHRGLGIKLELNLLGDSRASTWMSQAADCLNELEYDTGCPTAVSVPAGDVMIRLNLDQLMEPTDMTVYICAEADGSLPSNRIGLLSALSNSVRIETVRPESHWPDIVARERRPGLILIARDRHENPRIWIEPGQEMPETLLQELLLSSARKCIWRMDSALSNAYSERPALNDTDGRTEPAIRHSLEARERRLTLESTIKELRGKMPFKHISISRAVGTMDGSALIGTSPYATMCANDVDLSPDILIAALVRLQGLTLPKASPSGSANIKPKGVRSCFEYDQLLDAERDNGAASHEIVDLERPYFSHHQGMPVRVSKSFRIWRAHDTEALALDFFATRIDPKDHNPHNRELTEGEINHLHIADIYKVPRRG